MEFKCIPIIVILCFMLFKILIIIFKANNDLLNLMPIIIGAFGGAISFLIYLYYPDFINTSNPFDAILIGIVSGVSSTGTNSIIESIFKKKKINKENKKEEI